MDIALLKSICEELMLKQIKVEYFGKPMVWIESGSPVNWLTRKLIGFFSDSLKLFLFKNQWLSPYITIKGVK